MMCIILKTISSSILTLLTLPAPSLSSSDQVLVQKLVLIDVMYSPTIDEVEHFELFVLTWGKRELMSCFTVAIYLFDDFSSAA